MSAACAPSRASILTGQYPSLHGVTQTDGLAKSADSAGDVLARAQHGPDDRRLVPGRRLQDVLQGQMARLARAPRGCRRQGLSPDGRRERTPIAENVAAYLEADLLDAYGFSEWVGPEAHGLGKQNTGTARDPFTADETVALLKRLDQDGSEQPWLTVCSFLNPHDIALFGVIALAQGLRYDTELRAVRSRCADPQRRPVDQARLSTKLHRRVGEDARAAAVGGDAAAILLPAPADG